MTTLGQLLGRSPASIQKLTVSAPSSATSFAITPVNLNKSVVVPWVNLTKYQYSGDYVHLYTGHLESASSLRVDKGGAGNGWGMLNFSVIDFGGMVKSVQSGFLAAQATSAAIEPVDPAKSFIVEQFQMANVSTTSAFLPKVSGHTINVNSIDFLAFNRVRHWQLVEFW